MIHFVARINSSAASVTMAGTPCGRLWAVARNDAALIGAGERPLRPRPAAWLDLSPAKGEIPDNGSIEVAAKLGSAAQGLTPGTYNARITFKREGPGDPVVQPVRLLVSLSFR